MKDEDFVRSHWKTARVVETMASKDGLVRKVKLLISDSMLSKDGRRVRKASYLERPIHKLTVLIELQEHLDQKQITSHDLGGECACRRVCYPVQPPFG